MKKAFYILFAIVAFVSCYSNNCPVNNTVTCNYNFYDSEGNAIKYGSAITASLVTPGGKWMYYYRLMNEIIESETERPELVEEGYIQSKQYVHNAQVIYNKSSNLQTIQMPMSYFNPVDTILLKYSNITNTDTIYVEHESYAHVDLPECGSFRYHSLKNVRATDNAIDHVEIVNTTVNYDQNENIKIYFNVVATSN